MGRMNLHDYLRSEGALSVEALAKAIGAKDPAQVRQWRSPNSTRKPSAPYCVLIEKATQGAVTRQDLRPHDWRETWPELSARVKRESRRATAAGEG